MIYCIFINPGLPYYLKSIMLIMPFILCLYAIVAEFDTADIQCYEEVRRMAPFQRRVLVLVGAHGVGRRSLKEKLVKDDNRRFGGVIPRKILFFESQKI